MDACSNEVETVEPSCPALPHRSPWGFWSTTGLSLGIGVATLVVQIVFAIVWAVAYVVLGNREALDSLDQNGTFLLACTMVSYPVTLGLTILFIKVRKCDSLAGYLAIERVSVRMVLPWLFGLLGYLALSGAISEWFDIPIPSSMVELGRSSNVWFMAVVLIVAAPIVEELFFRGFVFKGLACSRLGAIGAILLTSLAWVSLHAFQYSWRECAALFILGLILGAARLKTGSVLVPIFLHVVNNGLALVSLMVAIQTGAV